MSSIIGRSRSAFCVGVVFVLVGLLLAGQAAPASASPTLNGEVFAWKSSSDNAFLTCTNAARLTYQLEFGNASGAYSGSMFESGTVNFSGGQVIGWAGTFSIRSGGTTLVNGDISLPPGTTGTGYCNQTIIPPSDTCLGRTDVVHASAQLAYTVNAQFTETGQSAIQMDISEQCGNTPSLNSTMSETFSTFRLPVATVTSPADGAAYSVGQAVNASYACADAPGAPGIQSCAGPVASGAAVDTSATGSHIFAVTATSLDGLSATTTAHYMVVGPPSVSISTPADGATFNPSQVVTASYSCAEFPGGPGIASCTGSVANGSPIDMSAIGAHAITVTATSVDGQSASATNHYTVLGAPQVTITSPASGVQYNLQQVVSAGYSCADAAGGPGIASCIGPVANGAAIDTATTGQHTFTVTATSLDGQSTSLTNTYMVVGSPTAIIASPIDGSTYNFGQVVLANYSCSDGPGGPGIASCNGPVPSGSQIDTSSAGAHTFSVTATSLDGQVATATVSYNIFTAAPTVLTEPASVTQFEGRPVSFSATATGTPLPSVQWQVSSDGGVTFTDVPGANAVTLTFNAAGTQNKNQYRALFSNAAGNALTTVATLGVISAQSSVVVTPPSVTADGKATATITVTVLDGNGHPTTSYVALNPTGTPSWIVNRGPGGKVGVTTFTATDFVPEVVTFTVVDVSDGVTIGSPVTVTFLGPSARSTVTASPVEVPADGTQSTVTVTLVDLNGNPVDGKIVNLYVTQTGPGSPVIANAGTAISDSAGRVFFKVSDQIPESATFTAYDDADGHLNVGSATVTFLGPSSLSTVRVTPPAVIADGTASSTIVITLLDRNGDPISGKIVSIPGYGSSARWSITPVVPVVTDASGRATFSVTDATVQIVSFAAIDTSDAPYVGTAPVGSGMVAFVPVGLGSVATGQGAGASVTSTSAGGSITVTAAGGSAGDMVAVGQYGSNPGGTLMGAAGTAFDILIKQPTAFTSLGVMDCNLGGGSSVSWWTGFAWQAVSPAPTYTAGPPACVTFVLSATSSPALGQLTGTVFAGVDTLPPSVNLFSTPASPTNSKSATFAFTAIDGDDSQSPLTVLCSLDGGQPAPCTSPATYSSLHSGSHTFTVTAVDRAGNSSSTTYTWRIRADGKIAYASLQADGSHIFSVNADGSGLTQLTFGRYFDSAPVYSPDGSLVALTSNRGGRIGLYVMSADGTNLRPIVGGPRFTFDGLCSWSPDGRSIVFSSNRSGHFALWIAKLDGTGLRQLTDNMGVDMTPAWSPDGTVIAFASFRSGASGVFSIAPDGTGLKRLTTGFDMSPSWSFDGRLAFTRTTSTGTAIYTSAADGSGATVVVAYGIAFSASWAPDGDRITFSAIVGETVEVYVVNSSGSGPVSRVSPNPGANGVSSWQAA